MSIHNDKGPNILLVTADQFRGDCLGCSGNKIIQTPNYDKLAAQGVYFSRAYSPDPICIPGRACMITGNYPHKCTGIKNNGGQVKDDQIKLPQLLTDNGYETYASGKLHYVPYTPPGEPDNLNGFQHAALTESGRILKLYDPQGKLRGVEAYADYLKDVGWGGYVRGHGIGNNDIHPGTSPLPEEHFVDAWVATQAMKFLDYHRENHNDKPFYLNVGFPKPHAPYDPPRPWDSMYDPREVPAPFVNRDGKSRNPHGLRTAIAHGVPLFSPETIQSTRAHYYGLISFQDKQLGRLMQYLEDNGLSENTIVLFVADHGDMMGDFGWFFKCVMNEGSCRIPFMIRYPGEIPDGRVSEEFVGLQDIVPTLAGLLNIELPGKVDGIDLTPLLKAKDFTGREYFVSYSMDPPNQTYMVRTDCWKYIYSENNGVEEFYDMVHDPNEEWNLIDKVEFREKIAAHRAKMIQWAKENKDIQILDNEKPVKTEIDTSSFEFNVNSMGWRWY